MREILFRGRDIAGNWHYGVPLVFTDNFACITAPHTYNKKVEINTLGQYTGLTDKNGKKIFEGDILGGFCNMQIEIYYDEQYCQFRAREECGFNHPIDYYSGYPIQFEVIGNIHDNPELLGSDRNDE